MRRRFKNIKTANGVKQKNRILNREEGNNNAKKINKRSNGLCVIAFIEKKIAKSFSIPDQLKIPILKYKSMAVSLSVIV